jgi:hypothetical protein
MKLKGSESAADKMPRLDANGDLTIKRGPGLLRSL